MDTKKLNPQCQAFGKMLRIISDVLGPYITATDRSNAMMYPFLSYARTITMAHRLHKVTPEMDANLDELFMEAWFEIMNKVLPFKLQFA
ncbi:hypothetical protein FDB72_01975 [Clostridium botulinum]|uniref:hypothetical protein n=1 Tax=Clostridium botulinum TaxID=1491 RepID=UPI0007DEB93C|nr:hypothetical protein [Clostridium botulinum]KEI91144.1 hypothetical protein N491_04205 [Clostridium botulinum B2 275]NFB55025.1 hypothetical protein [Clostridium botulinum]NFB58979.1 hypothetical protein [Clostridium botulinum]NFD30967.1 hypothetical protein [Clostridium botulinum]NFD32344.1 hypothetical protein [Clostridium botulinum]